MSDRCRIITVRSTWSQRGNTFAHAVVVLESAGFRVSRRGGQFVAVSARDRYVASDSVSPGAGQARRIMPLDVACD